MRRSYKALLAIVLCLGLVTGLSGQTTVGVFTKVRLGTCMLLTGSGVPESAITGSICDTYWRTGTAGLYLKETGTASNTGWGQVPTLGNAVTLTNKTLDAVRLSTGTINIAKVTLTDAQIKALPTTGISIVATPGSGLALLPLYGGLFSKTTSGAYTNIDAAGYLEVIVGTSALILSNVPNDVAITNGSATRLTQLLGSTTPRYAPLVPYVDTEDVDQWGPIPHIVDTSNITNQAITVDIVNGGSGNLTGGNAANALQVVVVYAVVAAP